MFFGCLIKENKPFKFNKTNHIIHLSQACLSDKADNSKVFLNLCVDDSEFNLCVLQKNRVESYKLDHFIAWGKKNKSYKLVMTGGSKKAEIHITGYIEMEDSDYNQDFIPGENFDVSKDGNNKIESTNVNQDTQLDLNEENIEINSNLNNTKNKEKVKKEENFEKKNKHKNKADSNFDIGKIENADKPNEKKDSFELKILQEKKNKEKEVQENKGNKENYEYINEGIEYESENDLFDDGDDEEIEQLLKKKRKSKDSEKHEKPQKLSEVKEKKNQDNDFNNKKQFNNKNGNYFNKNKSNNKNFNKNNSNYNPNKHFVKKNYEHTQGNNVNFNKNKEQGQHLQKGEKKMKIVLTQKIDRNTEYLNSIGL